jgi:hypothetical protein
VNKTRNIIAAALNYGMRESAFRLPSNPALAADVRREPHPGVLLYYSPAEVETIAEALAHGRRRGLTSARTADQIAVDEQDASSCASRHTPGCGSASSSLCGGEMLTSTAPSSPSAGR